MSCHCHFPFAHLFFDLVWRRQQRSEDRHMLFYRSIDKVQDVMRATNIPDNRV